VSAGPRSRLATGTGRRSPGARAPAATARVAAVTTRAAVMAVVAVVAVGALAAAPAVAATAAATAAVEVHHFRPSPFSARIRPRVLVVIGDSTGLTLGAALQATAPMGTTVLNKGLFGCGLAIGSEASDDPPKPGLAMFPACNSATSPAGQWPALYAKTLQGAGHDDTVLFVAGTWEVTDILRNGHWVNITQPAFQHYELAQIRNLVHIATAHGAHLILTTLPALPGGPTRSDRQDAQRRRLIYNHLVASAAKEFRKLVSVVNLAKVLSPGGVYRQDLDGVQVRAGLGLHTPAYAPGNPYIGNSSEAVADTFYNWLSPRIWPLILATGGSTRKPPG
jgi:hypothetical protein